VKIVSSGVHPAVKVVAIEKELFSPSLVYARTGRKTLHPGSTLVSRSKWKG
jgi:hypothetical protein